MAKSTILEVIPYAKNYCKNITNLIKKYTPANFKDMTLLKVI